MPATQGGQWDHISRWDHGKTGRMHVGMVVVEKIFRLHKPRDWMSVVWCASVQDKCRYKRTNGVDLFCCVTPGILGPFRHRKALRYSCTSGSIVTKGRLVITKYLDTLLAQGNRLRRSIYTSKYLYQQTSFTYITRRQESENISTCWHR